MDSFSGFHRTTEQVRTGMTEAESLGSNPTAATFSKNCRGQVILTLRTKIKLFPSGIRKGRGTRDEIANILWLIGQAREFQKNIYFYLLIMPKPLTVWITRNCGKF